MLIMAVAVPLQHRKLLISLSIAKHRLQKRRCFDELLRAHPGHGVGGICLFLIRIGTPMRTSLATIMHRFMKKRKHDTLIRVEKRTKHLSKSQLAESLGWIGAIFILGSYGLLTFDVIQGDSVLYHLLILFGSSGLAIITYRHRAFQSFIVNAAFGVLATFAIIRLLVLA